MEPPATRVAASSCGGVAHSLVPEDHVPEGIFVHRCSTCMRSLGLSSPSTGAGGLNDGKVSSHSPGEGAGRPRSRHAPSESCRAIPPCPAWLLVPFCNRSRSLARSCIHPVSAFVITWLLPVCVSVLSGLRTPVTGDEGPALCHFVSTNDICSDPISN